MDSLLQALKDLKEGVFDVSSFDNRGRYSFRVNTNQRLYQQFNSLYPGVCRSINEFVYWAIHYNEDFANFLYCPFCGARTKYDGGYYQTCGSRVCHGLAVGRSPERIRKASEVMRSDGYKEAQKERNRIKWGCDYPQQTQEKRKEASQLTKDRTELREATMVELYGAKNIMQTEFGQERLKSTMIEKYGVDNISKTEDFKKFSYEMSQDPIILAKRWETFHNNYPGFTNPLQLPISRIRQYASTVGNPDWVPRIIATKRRNRTFNTSKEETLVGKKLENTFGMVVDSQHSDSYRYPFHCDFYIKPLDLFIEYQGSWTHGFRPYDETIDWCVQQKIQWEEKAQTSKYYQTALYVWTDLDVRKRKTARKNKLNWLEFFSLYELEVWLLGQRPY